MDDNFEKYSAVLPQCVATKICETLRAKISIAAKTKWPNDIFVESKKVGGLLLEVIRRGRRVVAAVLGLGINVSSAPQLKNSPYEAGCLQEFSDKKLEFEVIATAIIQATVSAVDSFFVKIESPSEENFKNFGIN
jgi:biotin-(acetyl-CoA carboxylase) ligase